jgi:hypothetical protein
MWLGIPIMPLLLWHCDQMYTRSIYHMLSHYHARLIAKESLESGLHGTIIDGVKDTRHAHINVNSSPSNVCNS